MRKHGKTEYSTETENKTFNFGKQNKKNSHTNKKKSQASFASYVPDSQKY